jgi:hypothetical protein
MLAGPFLFALKEEEAHGAFPRVSWITYKRIIVCQSVLVVLRVKLFEQMNVPFCSLPLAPSMVVEVVLIRPACARCLRLSCASLVWTRPSATACKGEGKSVF